MPTLLFHVDAFTRTAFRGNPAAVVILDSPRDDAWMQAVAREMNVSETAFALPSAAPDGEAVFALRWFTPSTEVPLCGHATLATAAVLLGEGVVGGKVAFDTASGRLEVEQQGAALAMSLPSFELEPASNAHHIVAAAGVSPVDVRLARGARKLLVRVATESEVHAASPDFARLLAAGNPDSVFGLIVTAEGARKGQPGAPHFVSRYFAPWVGIDEDPVTGSAHCALGPYWGAVLGRKKMLAAQLSARGGELGVELISSDAGARVVLTGSCVVLSRGFLLQ
jgi:PhzF family phenazine biosynthesis protein